MIEPTLRGVGERRWIPGRPSAGSYANGRALATNRGAGHV